MKYVVLLAVALVAAVVGWRLYADLGREPVREAVREPAWPGLDMAEVRRIDVRGDVGSFSLVRRKDGWRIGFADHVTGEQVAGGAAAEASAGAPAQAVDKAVVSSAVSAGVASEAVTALSPSVPAAAMQGKAESGGERADMAGAEGQGAPPAPRVLRADPAKVGSVLEFLARTGPRKRLGVDAVRTAAAFGLDKPVLELTLAADAVWTILIGRTTPDGSGIYGKSSQDSDALLLDPAYGDVAARGADWYYDLRLLPVEAVDVERIRFEPHGRHGAGAWEAERSKDGFVFTWPDHLVGHPVAQGDMEQYLHAVATARGSGYLEPGQPAPVAWAVRGAVADVGGAGEAGKTGGAPVAKPEEGAATSGTDAVKAPDKALGKVRDKAREWPLYATIQVWSKGANEPGSMEIRRRKLASRQDFGADGQDGKNGKDGAKPQADPTQFAARTSWQDNWVVLDGPQMAALERRSFELRERRILALDIGGTAAMRLERIAEKGREADTLQAAKTAQGWEATPDGRELLGVDMMLWRLAELEFQAPPVAVLPDSAEHVLYWRLGADKDKGVALHFYLDPALPEGQCWLMAEGTAAFYPVSARLLEDLQGLLPLGEAQAPVSTAPVDPQVPSGPTGGSAAGAVDMQPTGSGQGSGDGAVGNATTNP